MTSAPLPEHRILLALETLVAGPGTIEERIKAIDSIIEPLEKNDLVYPFYEWLEGYATNDDGSAVARGLLNAVLAQLRSTIRDNIAAMARIVEDRDAQLQSRREVIKELREV